MKSMYYSSFKHEIFDPSLFHRTNVRSGFFEGWYFKAENRDGSSVFAVIFGVSVNSKDPHAFIQFFDGKNRRADYFTFPLSSFSADNSSFDIKIGKNRLSAKKCFLDINFEGREIHADIDINNIIPIEKNLFQPGAMGPFGYLPFLECNHHVISMNHTLCGEISVDLTPLRLDGGRGYMEKDWGTSFPSSYVCLQTNRFTDSDASFMFSLAKVPLMGLRFTGMISILRLKKREFRFATYNASRTEILNLSKNEFSALIQGRNNTLEVVAFKGEDAQLKSPVSGMMASKIGESLRGEVFVSLKNRRGELLFEGKGGNAGVEIEAAGKEEF